MARLPVLFGVAFVRAKGKIGYTWHHTRGSRMILIHPSRIRLSVPRHRELDRGLLRRLIRDAGVSLEEFAELLEG